MLTVTAIFFSHAKVDLQPSNEQLTIERHLLLYSTAKLELQRYVLEL